MRCSSLERQVGTVMLLYIMLMFAAVGACLHAALGWILVALVTLHVAAAAKHHLIDRDATLTRMLPFAATRRNDP